MRLVCGTCSAEQVASSEDDARCVECGATLRIASLAAELAAELDEPDEVDEPYVLRKRRDARTPAPLVLSAEAPRVALDSFVQAGSSVEDSLVESGSYIEAALLAAPPASDAPKPPVAFAGFAGPDPFAGPGLFDGPDPFAGPAFSASSDLFSASSSLAAPDAAGSSPAVEPREPEPHAEAFAASSTESKEPSLELVLLTPLPPPLAVEPAPSKGPAARPIPPRPPSSRMGPPSSSTVLPPSPFARPRTVPVPLPPRTRTGSHAAVSLDRDEPDAAVLRSHDAEPKASTPRTRTGTRQAISVALSPESPPTDTPAPAEEFVSLLDSVPGDEAEPAVAVGDEAKPAAAATDEAEPAAAASDEAEPAVAASDEAKPAAAATDEAKPATPDLGASARLDTGRVSPTRPPPVPPSSTSRAMLPGDRWYVLTPSGQVGPYKADELAQRFQSGELQWTMLVWRHGLRDWRAARRDELLVMAVAGTLGLGGKTRRLDGLPELLRASRPSTTGSPDAPPRVPTEPTEWLLEEVNDDTRVESWPLAMQLPPSPGPLGPPSTGTQELPASPDLQRSLSSQYTMSSQRALSAQHTLSSLSSQRSLSAQQSLSSQLSLSAQQRLSTSVPGSLTQRTRRPGTVPPPLPTRTQPGTPAELPARDIPTGRFPRNSSAAPPRRARGHATWIAALAFSAGVGVALMSGRIVAFSEKQPGARLGAEQPAVREPASALAAPAAASVREQAVRLPDSLATGIGTGNLEIVHRSLPALDEVRAELKRLAPTLRRCMRSPSTVLDVDLTIDGVTGRVRQLDVRAPALTPGGLECVKEGLSDLHVAPFVSSELLYRHRYGW